MTQSEQFHFLAGPLARPAPTFLEGLSALPKIRHIAQAVGPHSYSRHMRTMIFRWNDGSNYIITLPESRNGPDR